MLLKILLIIGVIAAVYYFFIKKSPAVSAPDSDNERRNGDETMVPCETCGVFVTTKEAFIKEGKFYCSKACMEEE